MEDDLNNLEEIVRLVSTKNAEQISEFCIHHGSSIFNGGDKNLQEIELVEQAPIIDITTQLKENENEGNHARVNTWLQLSSEDFANREELKDCVRKLAQDEGYVTVTRKSKPGCYVIIGCDRGGMYRGNVPMDKRKRSTGSRLINCPFEIKGKKKGNIWKVEIKSLLHNHEPSQDMSGHPMCRRFSSEEMETIRTMSMAGSAPREILTALRQSNPSIHAISRTMYNARVKMRNEDLKGRSVLEALLEELGEGGFIYDIERDESNHLTHLFFSHPSSVNLTKNFYNVFVMDCTYKTNKYNMPLLDIVGISSFNTSFYSCIVFMQKEEEEDYIWALERFKKILGANHTPIVIVTDRELALMNAINEVFPETRHLLCIWHIQKNVLAMCKKLFDRNEDFDTFLSTWINVMYSLDEQTFDVECNSFEVQYNNMPSALEYIRNAWLPYKERFVLAWTEKYLHFGNHVTSRAEGAHSMLKKYLQVSTGNLRQVKEKICLAIENQVKEIEVMLQSEKIRTSHDLHIPFFQRLIGNVSKHALEQLLNQYKLVVSGNPLDECRGYFQSIMGLPCAHKMMSSLNGTLELEDIHPQWRIDGRLFEKDKVEVNEDDELDILLKNFQTTYKKLPLGQKEDTRRRIMEVVDSSLSLGIQDPIINPHRGRPSSSKRKKNDNYTCRDPSEFEIVEKSRRCSKCGGLGHNSRTCMNVGS